MASMGVLQPNGLESLDDYSIISDHPIVNGDLFHNITNNEDCEGTSLHHAIMSATPDVSIEGLQSHLADVVQENASLKNQLEKNNQYMDQQMQNFQAIMAWHDDLTTAMSQKEVQLKEAEETISSFKKEILELQNKVAEMEKKSQNVQDAAVSTEDEPVLSDEEVDFEVVNRKEVKNVVDEHRVKMAHRKIAELEKIINKQNEQLKTYLCKDKKLQDKNKNKLEVITTEKLQSLKDEIEKSEQSLAIKEVELQEEKANHEDTKKMLSTVQTNYDRVTRLLQVQSKDEKEKDSVVEQWEQDAKMYLEKIDSVTAQLLSAQDELQGKENLIDALSSELQTLREESESIPVLKSQVEIYKEQINSVILAKEAAVEEVNRLTQQLHDNESMSPQDNIQRNSTMEGNSAGKGKKPNSFKKHEVKQIDGSYKCPICDAFCTSVSAYEKHVNRCLDKSEK